MSQDKSTPAPAENGPGQQMDDNVDDLGHKTGGGKVEQPTDPDKRDRKTDDNHKQRT